MNAERNLQGYISAIVSGAVGAFVFYLLHMPLPWMLGSLLGALIASNTPGIHIVSPTKLASPVRIVLGVAIGSAFTPALLDDVGKYLLSLLLLLPFLVVIIWTGMLYFQKIAGFERQTAFFCALPGGLIELALICESYGADMRRVVLIQTTRVLLIVYTVPFAIHHMTDVDLSGRTRMAAPLNVFPLDEGMILASAAVVGWWLMHRMRLPGASIVGPMLCSALVYTLGWATVRVPDELVNVAQLILGTSIGCAFMNISLREITRAVAITLGYFVVLMAMAMGMAIGVHLLTGTPLIATVLAYIPGGQAEMSVISLIVGVAIPFIALHHALRLILVMTVAPPLSALLLASSESSPKKTN
ncbi:MAG: AbrB family transcriptional regulator [Candidatus Sedimenticola sp. PURPLELP]